MAVRYSHFMHVASFSGFKENSVCQNYENFGSTGWAM